MPRDNTIDIVALKHELKTLAWNVAEGERRIKDLENDNAELKRKISAGKGVLFGLIIATGGIGVALVDYVKDWVGYVK
tara:strand:- start:21473 stop:21706 length:234 start_codon:yes stop_codon:yes gene_type:complete